MDEIHEDCEKCETPGTMVKLLSSPHIKTKSTAPRASRIGDLTNKFIEDNKEILKQQKKETKGKTHDPT